MHVQASQRETDFKDEMTGATDPTFSSLAPHLHQSSLVKVRDILEPPGPPFARRPSPSP